MCSKKLKISMFKVFILGFPLITVIGICRKCSDLFYIMKYWVDKNANYR